MFRIICKGYLLTRAYVTGGVPVLSSPRPRLLARRRACLRRCPAVPRFPLPAHAPQPRRIPRASRHRSGPPPLRAQRAAHRAAHSRLTLGLAGETRACFVFPSMRPLRPAASVVLAEGERPDDPERQLEAAGSEARQVGQRSYCALRLASRDATLPRRRRCRSAWLNSAARKVWTRSQATSSPTTRPPMQRTFM